MSVHITGQVGWNADGSLVGEGDAGAQTEKAFDNIAAILGPVGGGLEDLVSLMTFYVDQTDVAEISRVRARRLTLEHGPSSTAIRCAGLVEPELLVELHAVAAIPRARFRAPAVETLGGEA